MVSIFKRRIQIDPNSDLNNNGIPDQNEYSENDRNNNGLLDHLERGGVDTNADGVPDTKVEVSNELLSRHVPNIGDNIDSNPNTTINPIPEELGIDDSNMSGDLPEDMDLDLDSI